MSADAHEWLVFATADLRAAESLSTDSNVPARIACFHAQQAAEKALKAALVAGATPFRKTHDLVVLMGLVSSSLAVDLDGVDVLVLVPWAVDGRYPGELPDATPAETAQVLNVSRQIVLAVERHLTASG